MSTCSHAEYDNPCPICLVESEKNKYNRLDEFIRVAEDRIKYNKKNGMGKGPIRYKEAEFFTLEFLVEIGKHIRGK